MKASIFFLVFSYILSLTITTLNAQTVRDDLWVTNGRVTSIVENNGLLYVGGNFTYAGPNTGHGAILDTATGTPFPYFPYINGNVNAVIPDESGGWFIGGEFTSVGGLARSRLAHINASGIVSNWNPNANNTVLTLHLSGTTIYAGGKFSSVDGQTRNSIAAIDASTGTVTAWNPNADDDVITMSISGSTLYAGGIFFNIGGQVRNRIAAIDLVSGNATNWNPNAGGSVTSTALYDSTIYVGGNFSTIGGQQRGTLAELDLATGNATAWNPILGGDIFDLQISDSTVYVAGGFNSINSQTRNFIAAFNINTGQLTPWNPNANLNIRSLVINESVIYAGGQFTSIGGQDRNYIAAINKISGDILPLNPNAENSVYALAASGSTFFAGGWFTSIGGQERNSIVAIDTISGAATEWNPDVSGGIEALAVSGSAVYAGGSFTAVGGEARNRLATIDISSGNVTAWNPDANNTVRALEIQGSTLYAGGSFASMGGQTRNGLASFNISTGNVTGWNPNVAGGGIYAFKLSGSNIYFGGSFSSVEGQTRNKLAAVDYASGGVTAWNPNADAVNIYALDILGSSVYAGGQNFNGVGGVTRNGIAAIDITSGLATDWNPDPDGIIYGISAYGSNVYVGGQFTNIGGQDRNIIAAIDITSGLATDWNPNIDGYVDDIEVSGSMLYAGGSFDHVGGKFVPNFAGISISTESAAPVLQFSSDSLNFAYTATGSEKDLPVTIYSTGNTNLSISSKYLHGPNAAEFSVIQGLGASNIAAGDSQLVGLRFSPASAGIKTAYLIIDSDASSSPDTLLLKGFAIADTGWFSQTSGTTTWLRSVYFVDNYLGWTVGVGGTIMNTADGGLNWVPQSSGTSTNLNSVYFTDKDNGCVVGVGGEIYYTDNGGSNWTRQTSNTLNQFTSVFFSDNQNGWTVGAEGIIMQTSDGGQNWTPQTSGTTYMLSSVYFTDNQTGWIVGDAGVILHTTDGGQNWNTQIGATSNWLLSICLTDNQNGWIADYFGNIIHTNDGGQNWNTQINPTGDWLSSIYFNDNQNGWAVGSDGTIIHTSDGGQNWNAQSSPTTVDLKSVYFTDNQTGWIVGMYGDILHTIDSGGGTPMPPIQFSADSLNFQQTTVNGITDLPVTIYNTGTSNLDISSKNIDGPDATEFSVFQGGDASSIAAGDSEQVVIRFSPTSSGSKTAFLVIESNVASSPDTVTLNGIAVSDNNALFLDGDGDYVEVFDSPSLDITDEITVEAWINPSSLQDTTNRFLTKWKTEGASEGSWIFSIDSDSLLSMYVSSDGSVKGNGAIADTKLLIGEYTHIAGTYSISDNIIQVYLNGQKVGEQSGQGGLFASNSNVLIGAINYYLNESFFHGEIDEVRIWSIRRTLSQIRATISDTLGPEYYLTADSSLAAYWRFDKLEDLGINGDGIDDVRDLSVYQNHGDIYGNTTLVPSGAFTGSILPTLTVEVDSLPAGNSDIGIQIIPPEGFTPQTHILYYRRAGENAWQVTDLVPSGNDFQANIPSPFSTIRGVEYYIELDDGQDVITYPQTDPESHPAIIQVHINQMNTQSDLVTAKHKMISIPLNLSEADIASIFFDDYGPYDQRNWRLQYWDEGNQDYLEPPDLNSNFTPGFSCWFITRTGLPFDIENGKSVRSDSAYTISLQPGWNQIGNPFAFPILWANIGNSFLVGQPVFWNGEDYEYEITTINPWEGYFVNNIQNSIVNLNILPIENSTALEKKISSNTLSENEFIIQISSNDIRTHQSDKQNFVGMLKASKNGLDVRDYLQAPVILEKTELSIFDKDTLYAGNFKSVSAEGAWWDLQISPFSKNSKVRLGLDFLSDLPKLFNVYLLDMDYNCAIDLEKNKELFEFRNKEKRNLRLIVGKQSFAKSHNKEISLTPQEFKLEQNFPNPFNPATVISYSLAKSVKVKIDIFNILGQRVVTLLNASQKSGRQQIIWNGQNESGKMVGSGVYLYRLQADYFTAYKKMILIR